MNAIKKSIARNEANRLGMNRATFHYITDRVEKSVARHYRKVAAANYDTLFALLHSIDAEIQNDATIVALRTVMDN